MSGSEIGSPTAGFRSWGKHSVGTLHSEVGFLCIVTVGVGPHAVQSLVYGPVRVADRGSAYEPSLTP